MDRDTVRTARMFGLEIIDEHRLKEAKEPGILRHTCVGAADHGVRIYLQYVASNTVKREVIV